MTVERQKVEREKSTTRSGASKASGTAASGIAASGTAASGTAAHTDGGGEWVLARDPALQFLHNVWTAEAADRWLPQRLASLPTASGQGAGADRLPRIERATLLRHKPGRRCVIEYRVRSREGDSRDVLAKVRAKGFDHRAAAVQRTLFAAWQAGRLPFLVARPLADVPAYRLWVQAKLAGRPLAPLDVPDLPAVTRRIGAAIAALQAAPVTLPRSHPLPSELAHLQQRLAREPIGADPQVRRIVQRACELAAAWQQRPLRPAHRDFYHDQVLLAGRQLALIDFDLAAVADPGLDLGNFQAHLIELAVRRRGSATALAAAEQSLTAGYLEALPAPARREESQAIAFYCTLSLIRHIFLSRQFADRRHTTPALIALCRQRLALPPPRAGVSDEKSWN